MFSNASTFSFIDIDGNKKQSFKNLSNYRIKEFAVFLLLISRRFFSPYLVLFTFGWFLAMIHLYYKVNASLDLAWTNYLHIVSETELLSDVSF